MKITLTIFRWLVGLLFIFSGLIKANDPLGLSYKMLEFFEAWNWHFLDNYTLAFAFLMNVFEVLAGVAIIIGWRIKLFSWLLLLLIIFFTFLTSYVLFSGKITACGCFGDCVPLTPLQTFEKDIALLLMILLLFFNTGKIKSFFASFKSFIILAVTVVLVTGIQFYVLRHLPFLDCLPYKKGNDLLEQMKIPAGALPDSFAIQYKYTKNGKTVEFGADHFPADFDSTYQYVDRYDRLVRKGTAEAKIVDLSFQTLSGNDTTQAILHENNRYLLLFVKDFSNADDWKEQFQIVLKAALKKNIPVYLVTSQAGVASSLFSNVMILKCDATVIKTAARVTPTYFLMQGALILQKYSYADADKLQRRF